VDTDTGENKGDCCYGNQYSDGTSCKQCPEGADCSTVGSTLATLSMALGFWRASQATTDVRACWLAEACRDIDSYDTATATATAANARRTTDTTSAVVQAENDKQYCATGYKGPCKYTLYLKFISYFAKIAICC
jgi:hypothetical protein